MPDHIKTAVTKIVKNKTIVARNFLNMTTKFRIFLTCNFISKFSSLIYLLHIYEQTIAEVNLVNTLSIPKLKDC